MADPSIREDELAETLDYRCTRIAVYGDEHYAAQFALIVECIVRNMPDTISDVMESMSATRRAYVAALPQPNDPVPHEFDESRSDITPQQHQQASSTPSNIEFTPHTPFHKFITPYASDPLTCREIASRVAAQYQARPRSPYSAHAINADFSPSVPHRLGGSLRQAQP
jgi:hypothetical protein